ncbi:12072_t:CDS:1 [Ambispora gerdemannii]|uniref:RING-type E3 ubiquitin transferase n=1 Tax=Ambispora gerdemannii TaxID=144530 RepID=A0A9N9F9M8_9GLOM|nr:12072_t:CDS:1 [Ambispora gerdemannii]
MAQDNPNANMGVKVMIEQEQNENTINSFYKSFEEEEDSGQDNEDSILEDSPDSDHNDSNHSVSFSSDIGTEEETEKDIEHDGEDSITQNCCPICLHQFQNPSYVISCYHTFCFACIREWLSVSRTVLCPLCKARVEVIVHSIDENNNSFKKFLVDVDEEGFQDTLVPLRRRSKKYNNVQQQAKIWGSGSGSLLPSLDLSSSTTAIKNRRNIYNQDLTPKDSRGRVHSGSVSINTMKIEPRDLDRLRPFIERDLLALIPPDTYDNIILEYVQGLLVMPYQQPPPKRLISLWDEVYRLLRPLLGQWAEKFVEEACRFAFSGMDIVTWDRMVDYS